jgi:hypothetical protein
MKPSYLFIAAGVFSVVVAGAACSTTNSDELEAAATQAQLANLLDVNDVSILFPIKNGQLVPNINVDDTLWRQSNFNEVVAQARAEGMNEKATPDTLTKRQIYQPVALRFDPCAPGFGADALSKSPAGAGKCLIQFRVIMQPTLVKPGDLDGSAHLVFTLGSVARAELKNNEIVKAAAKLLIDIKKASTAAGAPTAGRPLGPHPGLAVEKNANVVAAVQALIADMLKRPNQRSIAFMGTAPKDTSNNNPAVWTFIAGTVGADGKWKVGSIPRLGAATKQTANFSQLDEGDSLLSPIEVDGDFSRSTTPVMLGKSTLAARRAIFEVENPATTHFFNTACVSCHTSSTRVYQEFIGEDAEDIQFRVRVPKGITGYVLKPNAQSGAYSLRNFGYFKGKPTVSGRTVAESVDVVDFLNTEVNPTREKVSDPKSPLLRGPGRDCTKVNQHALFLCLRDGDPGDCFKACGPAPVAEAAAPAPNPQPGVCAVSDPGATNTTNLRGGNDNVSAEIRNGEKLAFDGTSSGGRKGVTLSGWIVKANAVPCTGTNCREIKPQAPPVAPNPNFAAVLMNEANQPIGKLFLGAKVTQLVAPKRTSADGELMKVLIVGTVAADVCK